MSACALHTCTDIPPCGGGYGPTKSTFINESPAPELERDQRPELEVHGASLIVQFDKTLDIRFIKQAALETLSREQQVAHVHAELPTEPAAERDGEPALRPVQNFVRQN